MQKKPPSKKAKGMADYALDPEREIRLPYGIKEIGNSEFYESEMEGHLIIPSSVEKIGNYAFCFCSKLKSVTIPNSVKDIGIRAFAHCSNLKTINIGDEVEMIWNNAFEDCTSLTEIRLPKALLEVGHGMFRNCQSLKTVRITSKDTVINDVQVNQVKAIKDKHIQDPFREFNEDPNERALLHNVRIGYHEFVEMTVFKNCDSLERIIVPKGTMDYFKGSIPRYLHRMMIESDD